MKQHTNKHLRRALALFMTVLMAMSCMSAGMSVWAADLDVSNYPDRTWNTATNATATTGAYGVPIWNGTGTNSFTWDDFDGKDENYLYYQYPSDIYLDISESLEQTGYKAAFQAHYGNDDSYRLKLSGMLWGELDVANDSDYLNVPEAQITDSVFFNYGHVGTVSDTRRTTEANNTKSGDYWFHNDDVAQVYNNDTATNPGILYKYVNNSNEDYNEYVFLTGQPTKTGDYTYSTYGWGGSTGLVNFDWYGVSGLSWRWQVRSLLKDGSTHNSVTSASSVMKDGYKEIEINYHIYDKSTLAALIAGIDNGTITPTAEQSANLESARAVLNNRYVTKAQVEAAANSIGDRMTLLVSDNYPNYSASAASTGLGTAANTFDAQAYHQGAETTGAYSNLVYSPIGTTSWSGNGVGDVAWGVGRIDFKVAIPRNVVMVYDGVHEAYAPITLESRCNDTGGSSHIIHYADYNNDGSVYELKNDFWQGYSKTWDVWAKDNINTAEQFAAYWHDGGAPGESPDSQRDGDSRFWWNMIQYYGTGNTTSYYDHETNFKFDAKTSYKSSSRQYKYGTFTSLTDFYTINYQPVYSKLTDAAAVETELENNEWMYTDASVRRAKATIAAMVAANPKNFDYASDVAGQVAACAQKISDAAYMLDNDGLTLVKKTGTVIFKNFEGVEISRTSGDYGTVVTEPSLASLDRSSTETDKYDYDLITWNPAPQREANDAILIRGDVEYQAFDNRRLKTFTLSFYDGDGNKLMDAENVEWGTNFVYDEEMPAPTKTQTNDTVYAFNQKWADGTDSSATVYTNLPAVTADASYYAQFDASPREYTLTFYNGDIDNPYEIQTYHYNDPYVAPANPTIADSGDVKYKFAGWAAAPYEEEGWNTVVDIPATVTASANYYSLYNDYVTVTWMNGSTQIGETTDIMCGETPSFTGTTPTKVTPQYTYTSIGWATTNNATTALATLPAAGTSNLVFYAVYDETDSNENTTRTVNSYTVKWIVDGVETETTYEYGATPSYGTNPTKAEDATNTYEFSGWSPEIATVTGDATYTAQFTATAKTANYTNMDAALEKADAALAAAGITDDVKTAIETAVATAKRAAYNEDGEGNYTVQKTLDEENAQQKIDAAAAALMNTIQEYFDIDETTGAVTPKDAALQEFTVTWKKNAEAEAIKAVTVKYGKAVDSADIPDAPADDYDATKHYTYAWADTDLSAVTENKTVLAVATGTAHSFSAEWTWAEDASTATVALSCDCGYSETQNGTVSQKSHTNGTCLAKETTVYTATYGAYTAPDKTVEGDYGDHVYNAEYDQLIRPVKDENGTWSNGTKIWYCQTVGGTSNDEHNKTASVARANYDAFDELIAKVQGYLEQDITDEFRTAINNVLGMDEIKNLPDNLIVDEQTQVDAAVTILNAAYAQAKEGGILDEDGNITDNGYKHYTITFVTDGSAVESITGAKKGDEITLPETAKDGFHFEGWYTDETHADGTKAADPYTVTGDVTLYAFFEELSLNGDDVEAAIAAATAGVSGICYTEESYTAYTNAVAAVRAFKDQSATTENLTAYNNALAALDAAVAALVVEHAYTGQPAITRPVYDEATGTWSKGVKTWTCANNADHPVRTEEVDRADYATYDSVLEQISDLLDEDLTDDVKTALEEAKTALEAIPQNYITDEQATLDNAIQEILDTLKGNDKIDVDENNSITVDPDTAYKTYTLKLTNNVNTDYMEFTQKAGTTAHLNPGLSGYTLKGFSENANYNAETGIYTFPQRDDTITALYVKDLTDNEAITDANAIISDENDPDSGKDYDDDYIDDLNDLLDDIDAIKDDPTKIDELNEKLEDLQALVDKAEENRAYTITWSIDGVETTETYKVGDTPTHEDPTKEGFRFTGWEPAIVAVSGDATYTAVFTEISAEPADYSEYDALFEKLGTVVTNDVITDELKQEAQDKLDHPLDRDLTADQQQIIDDEVAAIKAILDKIFEKDGNGDYTDTVKDSAAIHYNVVFHWLDVTLTKTVVKGSGVSAPNVTEMYGVEGEANGHYVFDKWDKDFAVVNEGLDIYGSYKLADHTGAWIEHAATCSHVAYKEITCTTCGLHFEVNTGTEKADHDWNDWVESPATCAHPGSRTRTCKNDATHTEFEVIPQLAHTDANGDTICDVCGNPTENHQHTDVNGDGKCDTCGAKTNAHVHNYQNGVCTGCGQTQDGSFRCNMCPVWERYRSIPVAGWILTAIHFFYHLICQIVSWR